MAKEDVTVEVGLNVNTSQAESALSKFEAKLDGVSKKAIKTNPFNKMNWGTNFHSQRHGRGRAFGSALGPGGTAGASMPPTASSLPPAGGGGGGALPTPPSSGMPTGAGHGGGSSRGSGGGSGAGGGGKGGGWGAAMVRGGPFTVGQMRGGAAMAVAQISTQLIGISARAATQDILAQSNTGVSQQFRRSAIKKRAGAETTGTLIGAVAGGLIAAGFVAATGGAGALVLGAGAMGASLGAQTGGGLGATLGDLAGAPLQLQGAALEAVSARGFKGQGILRKLARARGSASSSGLGGGRNLRGLRATNRMGFNEEEAAAFAEMANVQGIGRAGMGGVRAGGMLTTGEELAGLTRSGFSAQAGMAGIGMFRRGGGGITRGERGVSALDNYMVASEFGLRGAGADAFSKRLSGMVESRFARTGLTTDVDATRTSLQHMARDPVLRERGGRNIGIQGNVLQSGMGLRNQLVNQIGGMMNQVAEFQTFGQGAASGGLLGGIKALEAQTFEGRRKQLGGLGGVTGDFAMMFAGKTSLEEAQALRNLPTGGADPAQATAHALNRNQIMNAGSGEYNTGHQLRRGEMARTQQALNLMDKIFTAIERNSANLERVIGVTAHRSLR